MDQWLRIALYGSVAYLSLQAFSTKLTAIKVYNVAHDEGLRIQALMDSGDYPQYLSCIPAMGADSEFTVQEEYVSGKLYHAQDAAIGIVGLALCECPAGTPPVTQIAGLATLSAVGLASAGIIGYKPPSGSAWDSINQIARLIHDGLGLP